MGGVGVGLGSDLDEIPSREFLTALKHCDVLPKVKPNPVVHYTRHGSPQTGVACYTSG